MYHWTTVQRDGGMEHTEGKTTQAQLLESKESRQKKFLCQFQARHCV